MSALAHIASAFFGADCAERMVSILSGNFTCYWDDSGSDPGTGTKSKSDTDIILVGGYLAHVDEWLELENRWKPILDEFGLKEFHMVSFANRRYPYGSWDDPKCDDLIGRLLDIIADCPRIWMVWVIEIDAYMEIIKARNLLEKDIVRAYHICARKCLEGVSDWARVAGYKQKILHIFDDGNSAWPTFEARLPNEMLDALNILRPIAQRKLDVVQLQAADVLAHQVGRNVLVSSGRALPPRRMYTNRLFGKPGVLKVIGIPELKNLYQEELMLEDMRSSNLYPSRISLGPIPPQNQQAVNGLFDDPGKYEINKLLRSLQ